MICKFCTKIQEFKKIMIETREKIIDGSTYSVTQLPARRALRMKAKLIKIFGPVLAQLFVSATSKEAGNMDFVKAIELLGSHIDENSFEQICMELLVGVRKDGMELQPATIDLEFAGDIAGLYKVLWFVIEVNYSNFFVFLGIGNDFLSQEQSQIVTTKRIYT